MSGFATPEEAARGGTAEEYVRVIASIVRGDAAIVAQVMNADAWPDAYEIETAVCHRGRDGWVCGSSGNGNLARITTEPGVMTVVWWSEAEPGVDAMLVQVDHHLQEVPVVDGFWVAVFDNVRDFSLLGRLDCEPVMR